LLELRNLKELCELELVRMGYAIESREFKPHVTLGRVREGRKANIQIPSFLGNYQSDQKCQVKEVVLCESIATSRGPIYEPLEHFPLRAP